MSTAPTNRSERLPHPPERDPAERLSLLRGTFDALSDGVFVVDQHLRVVFTNRQIDEWRAALGDSSVAVGQHLSAAMPALFKDCESEYRVVFETGKAQCQRRQHDLGERALFAEVRLTPILHAGKVTHVVTTMRDLADQPRTAAALRENTDSYDLIYFHSPLGIVTADLETHRIVQANPAFCKLLGYTEAELRRMRTIDVTHPDDVAAHYEALARHAAADVGAVTREKRYICKNGEVVQASLTTTVLRDEHGKLRMGIGIVEDVRARKQAEEALRQSEERFRLAFHHSGIGMAIVRVDGRIVAVNLALCQMLGYTREELQQKHFREITHPEDLPASETIYQNAVVGKADQFSIEKRYVRKDGSTVWAILNTSWLRDSAGKPLYCVSQVQDITERRAVETALRESEAQLRSLVEGSPVAMLVHVNGRMIFANPAAARLHGLEHPDDLVGRHMTEFIHGDSADLLNKMLQSLAAGGAGATACRLKIVRVGGSIADFECNASSIAFGGATARLVICHDLTDQLRAEHEYQTLFEQMTSGFALHELVCDDDGNPVDSRILKVNPAFERLTGLRAEDVIGRCTSQVFPGLDDYWLRMYSRVALYGESVEFEHYGRVLDRHFAVTSFRPAPGQFAILFTDNTERKRMEESLRASEEKFRLLSENIPVIVYSSLPDENSTATFLSGKVEELTGHPATAFLGDSELWNELIHPDDRARVWDAVEYHRSAKSILRVEYRIVHRNGSTRWVRDSATPVLDETREITRVDGVMEDITEQKLEQEKRLRLEEQLREAQKMEAVGTLAAGIAHDFNNLLTALLGYAESARYSLSSGHPAIGDLDGIVSVASQAAGVTRSLLTFSRKTPAHVEPLDLGRVIGDSVKLLRHMLPASIELSVQAEGELCIRGDVVQLGQVLMNLVVNARDSMPEGGKLMIRALHLPDPPADIWSAVLTGGRGIVQLIVEDTGCGMPADIVDRVRDPFFTTKRRGQGTGLGLSVVHGIVELHDGHLEIASNPGEGTTVTVSFPASEPAAVGSATNAPASTRRAVTGRILLAEDNEKVRGAVGAALRLARHDVVAAVDGAEALEYFLQKPCDFDAAVLDVDMPRLNGRECARQLLRLRPEMPIILISGYQSGPLEVHEQAPNVCFLPKPFPVSELTELLEMLMVSSGGAPCGPAPA